MASEVADNPQAVCEKIVAEDRKLVNETTNIELDKLSKEERMDAEDTPNQPHETLKCNFEVENVKDTKEGSAGTAEGENFLNLPSLTKVSVKANDGSPDAYEVAEKPDQTKKDACKIQSLEDEKIDNRPVEIISTKETTSEEIQQNAEELSSGLDKVEDSHAVPVESTVNSTDATSGLKVEDSIHVPDSEDARMDTEKLKDTSIAETGAEKFGSGKFAENFDVVLEEGSQETITFSEDTINLIENECEPQDQNNSESSFLKDAEDIAIQEGDKAATAPEVSEMVLENILNRSIGEEENQSTTLEEVGDHSIQTASEKTEENSLKQVDESQIKHEECLKNESGKLSSTEAPTQDKNHEGIETGDLKKANISDDERSSENYLPNEKPVESLHVSPEEIKTSASCQNAETISHSPEQRLFANPQEILSDKTKDKTIDAADAKDVATIDPNEAAGGSIPYGSANDLNVTHPLEEGKDNDGPSIDAPVNNSNNICSKEGGDQINNIEEDQDDSEASREVTEDQSKETESQVNDDQKMTSKPDGIESQMMDREHDTTIRSEATADETIKICQEVNDDQKMTSKPDDIETQVMDREHDTAIQSEATADETTKICKETTELKVTDSSENIEKIILLDENRNQHVSVASILEEKIAESSEGDKTITDIPSQEVGVSYQKQDGCIDSSTQIIDKDSGAKDNLTVVSAEETETEVSYEQEKKIKEPDTEILEQRLQNQDTDQHTATLEENSAKESSQEDEGNKESKSVEAEQSTREVLNAVVPSSAFGENKLDENLKKDERNIKNTEKEGTGENFEGTHISEDGKGKTLEHEEESGTTCIIQSSIQSEEEDMSSKDCLDSAQNLFSVSEISEGSGEDIIDTTEMAVTEGTEDPNLKEVELQDKIELDKNDLASEKPGVATSKPDKKEAESINIESEHESISNLGENRDVNVFVMGGNEANETVTGEITKYEVQNVTQAALSKCKDQVPAAGNVSQNTLELNLGESYSPSNEEQNLLPVSANETKDDNSENIEGSSIIPDSLSAVKTTENIDTEENVVGQDTARNFDDFSKENLDTQKSALESKTEHENGMEDLDINSMHIITDKNPESVEPTIELPSTSEPVIEFQVNRSNPENTITAMIDDDIKTMEEKNESIGEILISQHSLDGKVDTNDDGGEHRADDKQHIDSIQMLQGVEKANESDNTTEQEEKIIEQDFESSQRAESCETKIQLGADDPINRAPNCDQIITGGSLSEEILQVQRENESADSRGKIKEQIHEEGCLEDVQMIAAVDVAMHEEKGLDSSSIKNLDETLSDDSKEKITLDIAEDLNREQEESSLMKVPEDEKLANMTNLESVATQENSEYKIVHEPSSFHDKTDAKDVQVLDDSITFSSKENLVQVDPEESTELQVPSGEKVESMQHNPITVLEKIEEQQPRNASEAFSDEKMTLDIAEDLKWEQEESSVTKVSEDEKLIHMTSLASVATEENSDCKIFHEPSSFHDKTDTEDVQVLDDTITFSSKENLVQVDPEESTELQVPCGENVESVQQDPITILEEIEEQQPGNASEAVCKEKMTLDIVEDLNQEQKKSSVTEVSVDEKLANMTSLAYVATPENSDYKIVQEPSIFHDKTDTEDVQVLDDSITFSSKENLVQVDPEESTELQVPCGEKVESVQQDPIIVVEEIEEQQPGNASEAVGKEKMTPDIIEDLNQKQEESSVTEVSVDEKLANMTSLASVATPENSDYKFVQEPSSFHDKTDTEDVQVLDDSITFSSKENLVQVDPEESTELQVPCGEKVESMQQDPITVMEEIEEQQPRNASEAVSEAGGVNYEGATRTTDNCKEIMDSSSFVELDEISPSNPLQESKKKTLQVGEDEGTEKQQDDLHTLAHINDSPMGITQKDAQLCVASVDGSEDTRVMEKLVADSLPASDKNMVEESEFMESEFGENETSNKNIQQLQQEDTSETFLTDVKDMKPVEGEPEEAKCGQEKITVGETIESREESTSIEIAKSSPPDILQIYSVETSHAEDHSTKEKELTINREELHAEKTEPNEDGAKPREDKDEEEEASNQKESAVDVAIHEEKGLDSSSIRNLAETSSDDSKEKITLDITNGLNREQEESSGTKMSKDEKLASTASLASKATEENSDYKIVDESHSFHDKTDIRDVQVLEASITCSNKENIVQEDPTESTDQVPCGETVELMQRDPITVVEEIEEQQTESASEAVSEAKGVNREGEKRIADNCEEIMATSSFVALDEISHSKLLPESITETLQQGEEKETGNQHDGLRILAHTIDSPMEIKQKDAPLCIVSADGSEDTQGMQELEVASLQALDRHVVDKENYEEISHVEDHSTKEKEIIINEEELHEEKTEPIDIEDKRAKTQEEKEEEEEARKQKRSGFGSQALTLVEESDRDVTGSVSESPEENLNFKVKFNDKADTTPMSPSTVMKKETSLEEICVDGKSTKSHDETPEITNTTSDDLEGLEVESVRVAETAVSVPQSETIEAEHADIGSAVKKQSESNEVEFADEENKAGAVYKSNDQNVEELKSWEFPTLRKNKSENSEKETDRDYEKGFESKCERAEAVIEDNITCDQVKQEIQEKSLELLSKVQSCEIKLQSAENNDHRTNEEGMEHGDDTSKDEDRIIYRAKNEEVDNIVDSNLEILHPGKLEKVLESETQVQSFEVITKGEQTKTEEENLEAAKEEIRAEKTVAEEICEAKESKKIDMSSVKIKDEDEAVEDCQLGYPKEETIPERYQEDEEETEEDPKVKTEEAIESANENEKVSEKIEEAYVDENVGEHIVFDNKAVEEPNENLPTKESIDGILQVKEEGKVVEGITTIVNNQEKAHELDDVYVETEREVPSEEVNSSAVAFVEHGEDTTGANEDTGLQNKNINFSPMGDAAAGEPLDNENIISEAAPTKLIHETIEGCEDNKEIFMREQEVIEGKDEKLPISESLGDEESEAKQDKNQHEFETNKQLKDEVFISDKVQEKDEEQEMLSAGEREVKVGEADTCSRQTEGENINNYDQVENPDFSSHGKDISEISHSYGILGIAKDNENSTDIRTQEKIFTGTTKSEISEATYPNESGEAITSRVSKDIQLMEQDSEAITVDAEMQESKAGNASGDVQERTGVQCGEEEKADDDYKEMTETSTSMECAISTIMQGSAVETPELVEDQETQDQLAKLPDFPHLPNIQDSEMGKTDEDGPVDLQKTSNMTRDMQDLDERPIALLNKENLAETNPNESKKNKVSSDGKELELNQQDSVPPTLRQEIEKQQPGNSSEAVSDAKEAICEGEKVTTANCNEVTENDSCVASDKVSPYNMLQGSSRRAAQGTNDKNIPTQHHELPILSDIKFSDMERTQMDVELRVERVDGIDVRKVDQNLDAASIPASDKQSVIDADNTKNDDAFNSTVESKNIPQLQQDTAEIFQAEGEISKPCELEQEERTIESTKKSASTEIAKASLSDILQGPLKESSEMADHHTEGIEPTIQKKELNAEKTEEAEHLEEKDSHEESSEHKISDLGSEAPVMVDAGDVDAKVAHKKSHNILSGVGSKVKHSIAKVKKAIIGKSSHPKPTSPKESEKC
ncbi:titin [Forsythia ovata]|uniref:Titin n=1 Tax=Forsythia ovata TaxID=205694 RepID=A0ABD1UE50_9LAMI